MNIFAIFSKRHGLMSSIEDENNLQEGQTEFQSQHNTDERFFNCNSVSCTQAVFDAVKDKAGTLEAPKLIDNAAAEPDPSRINVYIENGSLKIA